jgi:hypothetical protein
MEQAKLGENEALFRSVNESYAAEAPLSDETRHPFLCECSNDACFEQVQLARAEYEWIRSDSRTFVVLPGHVMHEFDEVVERRVGFVVVRKRGEAGEVAEQVVERSN